MAFRHGIVNLGLHNSDFTSNDLTMDLGTLSLAAVATAFLHCIGGPDHYLPFVAMSRVGVWSLRKTLLITTLCGVGHIAGSAVLGLVGVAAGLLLYHYQPLLHFEALRGGLAAWMLVLFGVGYCLWGLIFVRAQSRRGHEHSEERMQHDHHHPHHHEQRNGRMTPWILFTIFVFGPCEPLIPLLLYPAERGNLWDAAWIVLLFGLTTLATMAVIVALMHRGLDHLRLRWLEAYRHALAGFVLAACGLTTILLGT